MVSYTLLIIIAVSLSILVYSYIKAFVPKDKPQCPEGIALIIQSAACNAQDSILTLSLTNKGRYSIPSAYIRLGEPGKKAKAWINRDTENPEEFNFAQLLTSDGASLLGADASLKPGVTITYGYNFLNDGVSQCNVGQLCEVEVQPSYFDENTKKIAACNAIATEEVLCGSSVVQPAQQGLSVKVFDVLDVPSPSSLSSINWNAAPTRTGSLINKAINFAQRSVNNINDAPLQGYFSWTLIDSSYNTGPREGWGAEFSGYLIVPQDGNYNFRLTSDDGSRIELDLNNNGAFDLTDKIVQIDKDSNMDSASSASITLTRGKYKIRIRWYNNVIANNQEGLIVSWNLNGGTWESIPSRWYTIN